jgi:cytochrome c biogenesis protein
MAPLAQKARNTWRALTSMGTALVLLFLLALGAIPGALLPQRSLNAGKVDDYLAAHPVLGPWLDRVEAFDVFASFWFTAIYVLLFVSLVGCLTPRMIEHAKSLRATPVPAPRNLARLPKHASAAVAGEPENVATTIAGRLRGWRCVTRGSEVIEISAERGYLREFGNLTFHFALLGLLVAVLVGKLFGYEGNVIVIADGGPGFCSASPAAFDSFRAGNTVNGTSLHPICIRVNNFAAHYLPSGQATSFSASIDYQAGSDLATNSWQPYRLEVNHPLRVEGDRVYLQGHGYAPTFTVTYPDGQTRTSTVQWRPDNPRTLLSSGAVRIDPPAGAYPADQRREHQIAIQGLLAPTEQLTGGLLSSSFPALYAPAVAVDIYAGDTGLDTGRPQSLYALDPRLIEAHRLSRVARVDLRAGEQVRLDSDGAVVGFDGAVPFVNLQVSHDPGQVWVLVSAIAMMGGLLVSLLVRRRRIWVRIRPGDGGTVNIALGGLARTDNSGWGDEFERLTGRLLDGFDAGGTSKPVGAGRNLA